jgi:hypothetical protein
VKKGVRYGNQKGKLNLGARGENIPEEMPKAVEGNLAAKPLYCYIPALEIRRPVEREMEKH